jgi:hypothetical protein
MLHRPIMPAAIKAMLHDLIVTMLADDAALGLMATLRGRIMPAALAAMLHQVVVTVLGNEATVGVMLGGAVVSVSLGAMLDRMGVRFSCRAARRGVWLRVMTSRGD